MHIYLNDKEIDIAAGTTLEALLADNGLDGPGIAAGVNSRAVRRPDRAATVLTEGDRVVVFKAACGG